MKHQKRQLEPCLYDLFKMFKRMVLYNQNMEVKTSSNYSDLMDDTKVYWKKKNEKLLFCVEYPIGYKSAYSTHSDNIQEHYLETITEVNTIIVDVHDFEEEYLDIVTKLAIFAKETVSETVQYTEAVYNNEII